MHGLNKKLQLVSFWVVQQQRLEGRVMFVSVGKIEMVKSKWGMAFAAVIMIMASLSMSVGICLMFGLTPSLSGR